MTKHPPAPLFRHGSLYSVVFREGNRRYIEEQQLIRRVASLTGKPQRCVRFALDILSNRRHRSNGGRTNVISDNRGIKIIALQQRLVTPSRSVLLRRYAKLIELLAQPEVPLSVVPVGERLVMPKNASVPILDWTPVGASDSEWQGHIHATVCFNDLGVRLTWILPLFPLLVEFPWRHTLSQVLLESHLDAFSEILTRLSPDRCDALLKGPRPVSHRLQLYERHGTWRIQFGVHISAVANAVTREALEPLP